MVVGSAVLFLGFMFKIYTTVRIILPCAEVLIDSVRQEVLPVVHTKDTGQKSYTEITLDQS